MEANKGRGSWVIDSYSGYPVRQLTAKLELNVRTKNSLTTAKVE